MPLPCDVRLCWINAARCVSYLLAQSPWAALHTRLKLIIAAWALTCLNAGGPYADTHPTSKIQNRVPGRRRGLHQVQVCRHPAGQHARNSAKNHYCIALPLHTRIAHMPMFLHPTTTKLNTECLGLAEICIKFKSVDIPLGNMLEILPKLTSRFYSISSSAKVHPDAIHVSCSRVNTPLPNGKFFRVRGFRRKFTRICLGARPLLLVAHPSSSAQSIAWLGPLLLTRYLNVSCRWRRSGSRSVCCCLVTLTRR